MPTSFYHKGGGGRRLLLDISEQRQDWCALFYRGEGRLIGTADWTDPVLRQVLEFCPWLDIVFRIADFWVINIATYAADVFSHLILLVFSLPFSKDSASDPHDCRPLIYGDEIVRGHAHGKLLHFHAGKV